MDRLITVVDRATSRVGVVDRIVGSLALRLLPNRKASACYGIYCGYVCGPAFDPCLYSSYIQAWSEDSWGCANGQYDCYGNETTCC